MRGWRPTLVTCMLLACTRDNPDFGDAAGGGKESTSGQDSDPDSDPPVESTTSGTPPLTSTVTTEPDGTTRTDATTVETVGSSGTGAAECTQPDASIGLGVSFAGNVEIPNCANVLDTGAGAITVNGSEVSVAPCGGCPCTDPASPPYQVGIDTGAELPALPECGHLVVWGTLTNTGDCQWAGVSVHAGTDDVPYALFSNDLMVPQYIVNGLTVMLLDDGPPCEGAQCVDAGPKKLQFGDEHDGLGVDDAPTVIELPFAAAIPFLVDNRMSHVDGSCGRFVSWTALPP